MKQEVTCYPQLAVDVKATARKSMPISSSVVPAFVDISVLGRLPSFFGIAASAAGGPGLKAVRITPQRMHSPAESSWHSTLRYPN
jgi:hypothetical protein